MPSRKIDIISGLSTDLNNNLLCCNDCQSVVCTFQNVHNTSLTIDGFSYELAAQNIGFSLQAVNGLPISLPIVVNSGDTFTFTLRICYLNVGLANILAVRFHTEEHDYEPTFVFPFTCVTLYDLGVPSTIDFGLVPASSTQSQNVFITNNTIGPVIINDINGPCGTSITITPTSYSIPIGATIPFLITWDAGPYPDSLNCYTNFDYGTTCAASVLVLGQTEDLDCDAGDSICCLDVSLYTDNNYLDVQSSACFPDDIYDNAAILDRKQIVYYLKYHEPFINGTVVYFNVGLYDESATYFNPYFPTNAIPPQYYARTYNSSLIDGTPYPMTLTNAGSSANMQKNIQAYVTFVDPSNGRFKITFDFFVVSDKKQIIDAGFFSNKYKYQKSSESSATIYTNTTPSVYLQDEYLSAYVVVQKLMNKVSFLHNYPFTARFYNQGLYGGASEFVDPIFTLSRTAGVVNTLSIIEPTKITFKIRDNGTLGLGGAAQIVLHLVDASLDDNTLQFLSATDASRSNISNNPFPTVLNNHLLSPSTKTTLLFGVEEVTCYVDTNLDPSHEYQLFAIVYSGSKKVVNTFKAPLTYRVTRIPEYSCDCVPGLTSYWSNYFETIQTDDYRPVGKERIKHRLVISDGDISNCLTNWGISLPDWRDVVSNIKVRIYKRYSNYPVDPNINYTSFFEFGTFESVRNNAFATGWQNLSSMKVIDMNNDIWVIINDIRVRWEDTLFNGNVSIADSNSYMNKTAITGATAATYISSLNVLNTWIDEDIYFEYEIVFDLSSYFTAPFKFSVCRAYMVSAISFENINSGFPDHIISQYIEGLDSSTNLWIPLSSPINYANFSEIRITYTANQPGWFNFFIETAPYGLPNLIESNAVVSPNEITFYPLPPIVDGQSTQYTGTPVPLEAIVRLDPTQFENTGYIFCGYWTQDSGTPPCWYFDIHTRISGSITQLVMDNVIYGNDIVMNFVNASFNSFLYLRLGSAIYGAPIPGNTYTFHYSFNVPTTRIIRIWFRQMGFTGTPDITLAPGSTNGIITFTWPTTGAMLDYWTIQLGLGSNYNAQALFAIGNEQCDE